MAKFFLDFPRDKYFDSTSSISFKSSTILSSESKLSSGFLIMHNLLWEKSQKKNFFLFWKTLSQQSLYEFWKSNFKEETSKQEFEIVLKVLHKRKSEVDEMWGMMKTQEQKFKELTEKNKELEEKAEKMKKEIKESCDKSSQVCFLQDLSLEKKQNELEIMERELVLKDAKLKQFEEFLSNKFDQLIIREKSLHQKEINFLSCNSAESTDKLLQTLSDSYKSSIFPEFFSDSLWLQLIEPSSITADQLSQLKEYEKSLFIKHSLIDSKIERFQEDLLWLESFKVSLLEREAKVAILEASKENLEKEVQRLQEKEKILESLASSLSLPKKRAKEMAHYDDWGLETDCEVQCDHINYMKIAIQELKTRGKASEDLQQAFIDNIVRLGEKLIDKEIEFRKIMKIKNEYLEQCKRELGQYRKMIELEEDLSKEQKNMQVEEKERKKTEIEVFNMRLLQENILEKQSYEINKTIFDLEAEEIEIAKLKLADEKAHYERLSSELSFKMAEFEHKLFDIKTILQLLFRITPGNISIFQQELSKILMKNEQKPEIASTLKKLMSLFMWLSKSFSLAFGKDLLRVKLSFYLIRLRVLMLKQGFVVAPIHFNTPTEYLWLEIFWLRSRHRYFSAPETCTHLVTYTKNWFFKFVLHRLESAFLIMKSANLRTKASFFYVLRNKCVENDKLKAQNLYCQLFRVKEKSLQEIRKEINKDATCKIIPFFEKFNKLWVLQSKIFFIRWRNASLQSENEYLKFTVCEIYSNLSELMHKEHKFKEQCKETQALLKTKIYESNKLLDKILF